MGDEVRIALPHAHVADGNVEPVGDDLRVSCLVPLPGRLAADQQRRSAFRVEAQRHPLVAICAAGIDIEGHSDAPQARPLPFFVLATARRAPTARIASLVQNRGEVARIVSLPQRRAVGHGVSGNHVAAAQRGGVEVEFVRRLVDQPLQQIDVLGPAGAAISVRRRRVGVGAAHPHVQHGRAVRPCERARPAHGGDGRPVVGGVGAEVGDALDRHRQELPVRIERKRRP